MDASEQLVDTWRIWTRVGLYVLDALDPAALVARTELKGRTIGDQFAHTHNVRLMWLKDTAADLHAELAKLDKDAAGDRATLRAALVASAEAIATMVGRGIEAGRIKGFKPHPTGFVGYLIAHESFHLGDIGVRLTQAGHPLDRKTDFGMWAWGVR